MTNAGKLPVLTFAALLLTSIGLLLIGPVAAGFLIQASAGGPADLAKFAPLVGMALLVALTLGSGVWMFWSLRRKI
ncbi:hypothetical protein ACWCW7_03445 [Nocardia tengchongensis]|uniref:Uncharacterized protein n=1 Tax=Nocardia tengchongensis TaxID=2055889 RepID=A0ABX8CIP7_9NOCA|nr:hypothetical protein [Nocardia tengchongensis]QVI18804.1 hypothetical protein KHQ06_19980 [Nocardia tengchongensis]